MTNKADTLGLRTGTTGRVKHAGRRGFLNFETSRSKSKA
jgi:hypothetical protein